MRFSASEQGWIPGTIYGVNNTLIEMESNNLASSYIEDNYEKLIQDVLKMGIDPSKNIDLVNDVFCRIVEREQNGNSYNPNKGKKGDYIAVEHYVYGMLGNYAKNIRYRSVRLDDPSFKEIPSSYTEDDNVVLTGNQMAYKFATAYEDIEYLDDKLSLVREIEYIISFESSLNISLRYLLKNIREISMHLDDIDISIFNKLKKLIKANNELAVAFASVVGFSAKNPELYDALVSDL